MIGTPFALSSDHPGWTSRPEVEVGGNKMAFYEWKESFCTNVGTMDLQHRKFVILLNELHDAVELKWDKACMDSLLADFSRYALTHFADEEKLLESVGYPELPHHRQEHEFFISQLLELQARHERGDALLGNSALLFLRDWFLNHILIEDQKYGVFLFGARDTLGERRRSPATGRF
jgi:hemerythrin-like metal-binding protein